MDEVERFGYKQELARTLLMFSSFAIGFSYISITTGIFTTYGPVLRTSGSIAIWTWPLVIGGQLLVALVFGALASRIPLAGYAYQWVSRLANPYLGWVVGWLVFMQTVIAALSVNYSLATTVLPFLLHYGSTPGTAWLSTAIITLAQILLIMFSTQWSKRVNNLAVATEIVGVLGLTVMLLAVGEGTGHLQWSNLVNTGGHGPIGNYFSLGSLTQDSPFVFGFLLGAYTVIGFEACSNLSEETAGASVKVPRAMWTSVAVSGAAGFLLLIAITAAAGRGVGNLAHSSTPIADIVGGVLGPILATLFLVVVAYSVFACGLVVTISATRITWALARDQRFPGWRALEKVHPRWQTPVVSAVFVGAVIEVVLALFANHPNTLFLLISAAIIPPILIYLITVILFAFVRRKLDQVQVFRLGRWETPIVVLALVWLSFELSIFRDSSFLAAWSYAAGMLAIGLLYLAWMFLSHRPMVMPDRQEGRPVSIRR